MDWLAPVVQWLADLGPWAPILFVLVYIVATVTLAPAFLLTVSAGAIFGILRGSVVVFIGALLGASAVYVLASPLARSRWLARLTRDRRVAAVRAAVVGEGTRVMFLLRLSPLVPFNVLNYALALSGVRYRDYAVALLGMIPAIVMFTYYGRIVGDVAALAAGVALPHGPEYYVLRAVGLAAVVVATTIITRAARRAIEREKKL